MSEVVQKPWYKKFKVLVTLATIIAELIIVLLGEKLTPEYQTIMQYVFIFGIALLSGHTITDTANALKKDK